MYRSKAPVRYLCDSWKNPEEFSTLRILPPKNTHCHFLRVVTCFHIKKIKTKPIQLEGSTLKLQFSIKRLNITCKVMTSSSSRLRITCRAVKRQVVGLHHTRSDSVGQGWEFLPCSQGMLLLVWGPP